MPKNQTRKTERTGAGRKPLTWTAERKAIARRISIIRDSYGSGNKLKKVASSTALGWCAPPDERVANAWASVRTPDVPSLLKFARKTGWSVMWILYGPPHSEKPETTRLTADIASDLSAHVRSELRLRPENADLSDGDLSPFPDKLLRFVVEAVQKDVRRARQPVLSNAIRSVRQAVLDASHALPDTPRVNAMLREVRKAQQAAELDTMRIERANGLRGLSLTPLNPPVRTVLDEKERARLTRHYESHLADKVLEFDLMAEVDAGNISVAVPEYEPETLPDFEIRALPPRQPSY